ncbi:MAG: T9SS type A sorting domain-containing protein [Candidatus Krumholzibacteriota bacterium]
MKSNLRILTILLLSLLLSGNALADNVTFDNEPLGTFYGIPSGMLPGAFMFHEYGANLHLANFYSGGTPYFNYAQIDPMYGSPIFFGTNQTLEINNVGVLFDFSSAADVTFEYLNQGGSVNMQVNGFGVVLEGPNLASLAGLVAPGVTMNVTTIAVPGGGVKGLVTLTGPVATMQVGGQELWIDHVRCDNGYVSPIVGGCDYLVDHESQAVGNTWGSGTHLPGDLMFVEDGIPVHIGVIDWGGPTGFNFCDIQAPGIADFGSGLAMNINNVSNEYHISALGILVQSVSFEYIDLGGMENLQVNGATLHIGDLDLFPTAVAPGVTMSVTTFPMPVGQRGEVVLTGDVQKLLLAGQEFMVDNVCVKEVGGANDCDLVSDNESQPAGMFWGGPYGDLPGDVIFTEDGIDVGLAEFDDGSGLQFNSVSTGAPWGPLGTGNVLHINNIGVTYDLTPFVPVASVSFDYVKGSGVENLGIDGILYVGPIETIPAGFFPGVSVNVSVTGGPGYIYGTVTLVGNLQRLLVGGQQFYIDDLCVRLGSASAVPQGTHSSIHLQPSYPNPFNPSTTLRFSLAKAGHVRLSIVDIAGRRLATLVDGVKQAGVHQLVWHGQDDTGRQVASGMYFIRMESGGQVAIQKIAMLK